MVICRKSPISLRSKLTGITAQKDRDHKIESCNSVFAEYTGRGKEDDLVGITDYDLPWAEYADLYKQHEQDALAGNHYTTIIPLTDYTGEKKLFMHNKSQRLDSLGRVVGLECHAIEIINADAQKFGHYLASVCQSQQPTFTVNKKLGSVELSDRQKEILFLTINGKTAKEIARCVGISYRTVEHHLDAIRYKFQCRSKAELITTAIESGYQEALPVVGNSFKSLHSKLLT